ncbi:MAG: hypothetical protein HYT79_08770 [Elusimicrobia bacterium]|nr:hypothetical protein [Elusimicrobiota bacterium]
MKKLLTILLLTTISFAWTHADDSNDNDISSPIPYPPLKSKLEREGRLEDGAYIFQAEQIALGRILESDAPAITGFFDITDKHLQHYPARRAKVSLTCPSGGVTAVPVNDDGSFSIEPSDRASGRCVIRFHLDNNRFAYESPDGKSYAWEGPTVNLPLEHTVSIGIYRLNPQQANGQIGFIHLTYSQAMDFFTVNHIELDPWWRTTKIVWPAQADFYRPGAHKVHLTNAEAWDVNLHELGHAIVATFTNSSPAGGSHKIDECYSQALAWSEGFPTFFAAAARFSLLDEDPKFEYLVPRRAPIQIENVPSDVCTGETNEWRVAAALWDLADFHVDGNDRAVISIAQMWAALLEGRISGFRSAWNLIERTLTPEETAKAKDAIKNNTIDYWAAPARVRTKAPASVRWD